MIVVRFTWHYQGTRFATAQRLVTEPSMPESTALRGWRVYRSRTGLQDTIALEWEFENLADWEGFSAEFFALPANVEFFRKWREVEPDSSICDVWEVIATG
jgi:hypothetical protein